MLRGCPRPVPHFFFLLHPHRRLSRHHTPPHWQFTTPTNRIQPPFTQPHPTPSDQLRPNPLCSSNLPDENSSNIFQPLSQLPSFGTPFFSILSSPPFGRIGAEEYFFPPRRKIIHRGGESWAALPFHLFLVPRVTTVFYESNSSCGRLLGWRFCTAPVCRQWSGPKALMTKGRSKQNL